MKRYEPEEQFLSNLCFFIKNVFFKIFFSWWNFERKKKNEEKWILLLFGNFHFCFIFVNSLYQQITLLFFRLLLSCEPVSKFLQSDIIFIVILKCNFNSFSNVKSLKGPKIKNKNTYSSHPESIYYVLLKLKTELTNCLTLEF